MYRVKQSVIFLSEDERYYLTEGELVELPGAVAEALLSLGYVEKAKGSTAAIETPESKRAKPERRQKRA